ncbi:MAG: peptidase [Herpetosiphonaceae bacterium]|nr:MAG: peptidase [Herpetosiphonaceae bacterium]
MLHAVPSWHVHHHARRMYHLSLSGLGLGLLMSIETTTITLVPIGSVPSDLLVWLQDRLREELQLAVVVDEAIPLPGQSYNDRRGQYQGDALLIALRGYRLHGVQRIVGLIDADCYAPGLNFIFGQASINGREAVVVLPRLRQSYYGLPEDQPLFRERVLKEIVHELGHTWGLGHCPNPQCIMHFSNTLQDTDRKGLAFCPRCHTQLHEQHWQAAGS